MNRHQLIFPHGTWLQCRESLFLPDGSEGFQMALARPCQREGGLAFVVEQLVDAEAIGYSQRSRGGLTLSWEASNRMNLLSLRSAAAGLVPVHLHSHPPGVTNFSGYDDEHESRLHDWLANRGQPLLWSLVWPYHGKPVARLWAHGNPTAGTVRAGLRPFGCNGDSAPLEALARQRAFGTGLRQAAATLRVGIVGVGGIGFPVAEQLARCGFTQFVLVDDDRVEKTNLNRLPGTRPRDLGRAKVHVARRLIEQAGRCIGTQPSVRACVQNVYTAGGRLKNLLRQCDVILALTDDEVSRITCLQLALEGGAEYLQAGVDVRLADDGRITGLFAEVTGAEVNRYCPLCTGRLDPGQASVDARRYAGADVWERAKQEGYVPQVSAPSVMSLNALAAGALVLEIQRRVSGLGVRDYWRLDLQNGELLTHENIEQQLDGVCEVCGRGEHTANAKPAPVPDAHAPVLAEPAPSNPATPIEPSPGQGARNGHDSGVVAGDGELVETSQSSTPPLPLPSIPTGS